MAGGTDLTIAMHEGEVCPDILIDVSRTEEMRRISESGGKIVIGAAVTFTEAENDPTIKIFSLDSEGGIRRGLKTDTQPRNDRRQPRERLAGGRYAAAADGA
ncbi:MAG: FAD binding domain-containing protein [Cloacibacillus evryensis]